MFVSHLLLIADLTLSPFYLPGCLEVWQPFFNHEDKSQMLGALKEDDRILVDTLKQRHQPLTAYSELIFLHGIKKKKNPFFV